MSNFTVKYLALILVFISLEIVIIAEPLLGTTVVLSEQIITLNAIVAIVLIFLTMILKRKELITIVLTTHNFKLNYIFGFYIYNAIDILLIATLISKGYIDIVLGLIIITLELAITIMYLVISFNIQNFTIKIINIRLKQVLLYVVLVGLYVSEAVLQPKGMSVSIVIILMYIIFIGYYANSQYLILRENL